MGVEVQAANTRAHAELLITDGRQDNHIGERYVFEPRRIPYDSIIIEGKTGHVSLTALRWLSKHNIPIFFLDFDGSLISSILPPMPVKADLRVAQIQAANNPSKKFTIAHALVKAKIQRSLEVLTWLEGRYDVEREVQAAKREAARLGNARAVNQLRTVEGRVALRYWESFRKALPEQLRFQGRMTTSHNNNATDPFNAALNYGYGYLKIEVRKAINSVGLEPSAGFLHELSHDETRESLVYDLEELFRWLIDITAIEMFETSKLNLSDFAFTKDDYHYRIETEGRRRLLDSLRDTFNSGVNYKGKILKWDTVIEEKTNELARYLNGSRPELDFSEPSPVLERQDSREVRERILTLSQSDAEGLGIGRSELHYLRRKARDRQFFRIYSKMKERIGIGI